MSFVCLLLFFLLSVVLATFVSLFARFDCSKWQISYCSGQLSLSRFLLVEAETVEAEAIGVEAETVDEIAASTSLVRIHRVIFYVSNRLTKLMIKA